MLKQRRSNCAVDVGGMTGGGGGHGDLRSYHCRTAWRSSFSNRFGLGSVAIKIGVRGCGAVLGYKRMLFTIFTDYYVLSIYAVI